MDIHKVKYRFLLLVPYTYPDYSGSGRNAFNFGKFLVKKGIPVRLITLNRNLRYKHHERVEGLNIQRIAYFNKNLFLKIISLSWILSVCFFRICSSNIIYVFGKNMIAWQFVVFFARICCKKIIFRSLIYGEDDVSALTTSKSSIKRVFHKCLVRNLSCYYSIHPGFTAKYLNVIGSNLNLLEAPQGVDTDHFHPVSPEEKNCIRKKLGLEENAFIIITIAFLIHRKGFAEIFKQLQWFKKPVQYIIIGEYNFGEKHFLVNYNNEASELRKMGSDLLGSKLYLSGPKENIREYLQAADVCLFNSKAEGLPNSMLEAMACGIPVVSNPITGLEGYILLNQENAMIFSQITELNKVLGLLYDHPDLRQKIGNKASETIHRMGSFDIVLKRILSHLQIEPS